MQSFFFVFHAPKMFTWKDCDKYINDYNMFFRICQWHDEYIVYLILHHLVEKQFWYDYGYTVII